MADFMGNLFGGAKSGDAAAAKRHSDFADFAGAPQAGPDAAFPQAPGQVQWTKWYNVHERHSLSEFKAEGIILLVSTVIVLLHILGSRANRTKARQWMKVHANAIKSEFASVGFGGVPTMDSELDTNTLLREKSLFQHDLYATGRQNVAFMDVRITLQKRFNPFVNFAETAAAFFIDAIDAPQDTLEATIYPFDGKEDLTVPPLPGAAERSANDGKSTFDGFVWAIVNKDRMQQVRNDRYDLSLTATKDNSKLPNWLTIMSENAEITNTFLTPELISVIEAAGDLFDHLIISDQPVDKPTTIQETTPRKRIFLRYRLPSSDKYENLLPLFTYFLDLPDALVQQAHFRPEVLKRVRATREQMVSQMKKVAEEEKNEERALEKERLKKAKRDAELKGLDAKAQKKYLEKEKEKELRKSQKKMTSRG